VPIKTFADWNDARPGFLEIDLVAHCGSTSAGQFLFTLSTVDVATGWMLCRGVRNKGEEAVFEELAEIRRRLPFPLLGLDSDNGGEFINRTLVHYCEDESITLTAPGRIVRTTVATSSRKTGQWFVAWWATPASKGTRCRP